MKIQLFVFLILSLCQISYADSGAVADSPTGAANFRKKAESKRNSRWTLQEWLAQKERNRMMDLWLAMYKPSPYEFYVQGSADQYVLNTNGAKIDSYRSYSGSVAFYALIMGIEAQYDNNTVDDYQDLSGVLNLRIAGNAVQSTHMSINYGLKRKSITTQNVEFLQHFAGINMDIYVNKGVGLHTHYRHYIPTTETTLGEVTGNRTEAGLFFDIEFIRLYGTWFTENFDTKTTTETTKKERIGVQTGVRFFF